MKNQFIFNSLGSNYSWKDAIVAMQGFFSPRKDAFAELTNILRQLFPKYSATPTYKGRDALEIALKSLGVGIGDVVLTQAFSCFAVEEAIIRCGAKPLYYDVQATSLAPDQETLNEAINRHISSGSKKKLIKAIVVQFTLGTTATNSWISKWSQQHQIAYIADLAQTIGSVSESEFVGNGADAIVLSTGRDKIWDAVSGGFVLTQQPLAKALEPKLVVGVRQTLRDCCYPFFALLIRLTYPTQFGRIIHYVVTKIGLFYSPIESIYTQPAQMSPTLATFVLHRWQSVLPEIQHRRTIAQEYHRYLNKVSLVTQEEIVSGANLRFPLHVDSTKNTIALLKRHHVFIADRWYRKVVDGGTTNHRSLYSIGSCPNAEVAALHCINLPTHREMTQERAKQIAQLIV